MDNGDIPPDLQPVDPAVHPLLVDDAIELSPDETRMTQRLGAAVVSAWFVLPRDIQKHLFNLAVQASDAKRLRGDIARFLHETGGET
ncbi:MAG: hypothetical protein ACTHLA_06455 [Asticcacaulis sp.]|jgi:hypothetical protein|uniref:hypothetical protein n=1 Tax=Asticcacaulis sp. TaxID=1872648 RepID=UPI003F7B8AB1